ncbi:hypothetical protein C8J57DRAFT_1579340 [Mycena rebaudengoi]|nr:hypothetical protein C8J57DRAFT_1579340 [Mycena rebaudengoi]
MYHIPTYTCANRQCIRSSHPSSITYTPPPPHELSLPSPSLKSTSTQTTDNGKFQTANWADDASSLPIYLTPSTPSPAPPSCDFSALSTGNPNPFSSLQCQLTCSSHPHFRSCRRHSSQSKKLDTKVYFIQSTPPTSYCSAPHLPPSSTHLPPPSSTHFMSVNIPTQLDWDHDPHLRDLGRALMALGWVRGGGG